MMQRLKCAGVGGLLAAVMATGGCATVNPRPDYDRTAEDVEEATGHPLTYRPDDQARIAAQVEELLRDGLTADEAAQIYLLNNRKLQASLYEIGAARADVVQASLLSNPTLSIGLGFPDGGGLAKFDAALVQNIADLWQIPTRVRAAERTLDRTILQIANEASVAVVDAKTAYFRARQGDRRCAIAAENVRIAQQVLELALARQQAGAGGEVDVDLARSEVLEADLALRVVKLEAFEARAALVTLLSLARHPDQVELRAAVPEPPDWRASDETLIALASAHRLDLQAAQSATEAALARVYEEKLKLFPTLELGVGFERQEKRPVEGRNILADSVAASIAEGQPTLELAPQEKQGTHTLLGPTLGMELPIFNQNQGGIARAQYIYEQTLKLLDDLRLKVLQDVRVANTRARTAWGIVSFYRDQMLPLREASLELARTAYQAGRIPLLNVLEAERALLNARGGYVDALQTSAATLVELEKVTGQPLAKIIEAVQADRPSSGGTSQPGSADRAPVTDPIRETEP